MLKIDIYQDGDTIRVRFPARSWESAHGVIQAIRDAPPDGYKLTDSRVAPKGSFRSGKRCNVRMTLRYCDSRCTRFTESEALEFFQSDAARAAKELVPGPGIGPHPSCGT